MIESIKLINWRSHSNTTLNFEKGTNLVIGIMGSGKSSIMDGISFGLFGTFPQLEARRLKIQDLFRYDSKELEVELSIHWDGKKYKIIRKVKRKDNKHSVESHLYQDSKLMEKGNRAVTQYLEQLLKLDYNLFTRSIYSEQNSIDYFLSLNPRKRKDEFDSLLGLDRFERVRANLTTLVNRVKIRRKSLESNFNEERLGKVEQDVKEREGKKGEVERKISEIRIEGGKLEPKLDGLEKENEQMLKKEKETLEQEKQEVRIKTMIENYGKRIEEKKIDEITLQDMEGELKKIEKERMVGDKELEKIRLYIITKNKETAKLENLNIRKKNLGKKLLELGDSEKFEDLEKELERLEVEIRKKESNVTRIKIEIGEIKEIVEKLGKEHKECPFCGSEMNKEKTERIIEGKRKQEKEYLHELNQIIKELGLDRLNNRKKRGILEEIRNKNNKRKLILDEFGKIKVSEKDIMKNREEIGKYEKKYKRLNEDGEREKEKKDMVEKKIKDRKELLKLKKELERLKEELPEIKEKREQIGFDAVKKKELQEELEKTKIRMEKIRNESKSLEKEERYLTEMINESKTALKELRKITEKIGKLSELEESLLVYKGIVVEVQVLLRDQMIESINAAMNEIWTMFYPYGDYKKLRVKITENDYDFEVYDSRWKSIESVVSGGERACVALTLRVALATVLTPNLSWLILDEPTHNLDRGTIQLLSETLQTKVPEIILQTIVITHEELLSGANFSKSYKLKRDKETLEATKLEIL